MALTKKQIEAAVRASGGNITQAAYSLGVTRGALYKRMKAMPEIWDVVTHERESIADLAESTLRQNIEKGDVASTIFALKTLGKSRGYVERQEVTGADGGSIKIEDEAQAATERILQRLERVATNLAR